MKASLLLTFSDDATSTILEVDPESQDGEWVTAASLFPTRIIRLLGMLTKPPSLLSSTIVTNDHYQHDHQIVSDLLYSIDQQLFTMSRMVGQHNGGLQLQQSRSPLKSIDMLRIG